MDKCARFLPFDLSSLSTPFYHAIWKQGEGMDVIKHIDEMVIFKEMRYWDWRQSEELDVWIALYLMMGSSCL